MHEFEVIFSVSLQGKEAVKKFRTMVPAEDEVQAYDKAIAFAENKLKVEIISINETDFVIPLDDPKKLDDLEQMIEMGEIAKVFKKIDSVREELDIKNPDSVKTAINYFRELSRCMSKMADILESDLT